MTRASVNALLCGVCPLTLKNGDPEVRAVLECFEEQEGLVFRLVLWAVNPRSPSTSILDVKEEVLADKYFPHGVDTEFIAAWAEEVTSRALAWPDVALPRDFFHNGREPISRVFQKRPENRRAALRTWFKNHKSFR
jgi:hypothetical protein